MAKTARKSEKRAAAEAAEPEQPEVAPEVAPEPASEPPPPPAPPKPAPKAKAKAKPAPEPTERVITVKVWARGRTDNPIVAAFAADQMRDRLVKRTPAAWMALFRAWVKQPRG
jgi:hypothetical protein